MLLSQTLRIEWTHHEDEAIFSRVLSRFSSSTNVRIQQARDAGRVPLDIISQHIMLPKVIIPLCSDSVMRCPLEPKQNISRVVKIRVCGFNTNITCHLGFRPAADSRRRNTRFLSKVKKLYYFMGANREVVWLMV